MDSVLRVFEDIDSHIKNVQSIEDNYKFQPNYAYLWISAVKNLEDEPLQ